MSPIATQIAARTLGRRQFSIIRSLRAVGRSMESHPFERLPVTQKPQKPDYGKMMRRVGSQAVM